MQFFIEGGHVYAKSALYGHTAAVADFGREYGSHVSALELAEFLNWMHEIYSRDKLSPKISSGESQLCELDGRCG